MEINAERILNVGCGETKFGTDFVDLYPQREEVKKADIENEKLPYQDNTFDLVFSHCLFEHLENPGTALEEMKRVTKDNGKIQIITDNASYFRFGVNNSPHTGGYADNPVGGEQDRHFELYTAKHLQNLFQSHNLETVKSIYVNNEPQLKESMLNYLIRRTQFWRISYQYIYAEAKV